ncbi:MAG: hypothetical protein JXQ67_00090 [Campylobacterales bacterium]|nr:hypothetical protein [Campylobacterales bacterium]
MKNIKAISSAIFLATTLIFSGCGESDNGVTESGFDMSSLESGKQILYFYGASTNDHYAIDVTTGTIENLNDFNETQMLSTDAGKLFMFVDDLGDDNASNDVDKAMMFHADFSYDVVNDGNATWENFYYLDHLHDGARHPHTNDEFNVTSGSKYNAIQRLNEYFQEQQTLKQELADTALNDGSADNDAVNNIDGICNFYTLRHEDENETSYFVLGTDGKMYSYDDNGTINFRDVTVIADSCEPNKSGISAAEEGVLVYLGTTSKLYLVDSHGDGVSHVHSSWSLSEVLGDGIGIDMMIGMGSLEHDDEHEH